MWAGLLARILEKDPTRRLTVSEIGICAQEIVEYAVLLITKASDGDLGSPFSQAHAAPDEQPVIAVLRRRPALDETVAFFSDV